MNQKNVDALTSLIVRCASVPMSDVAVRALAEALAAYGVIVPSVLTDAQVSTLGLPGELGHDLRSEAVVGAEVRAALIALAKGDID
jgi:hypothetical protein